MLKAEQRSSAEILSPEKKAGSRQECKQYSMLVIDEE